MFFVYTRHILNNNKEKQGFVVLTIAILLSVASIIFTAHMASSQLVDNQIIGNYYRNKQAFINAESGINFVLSQLDTPSVAEKILKNLPFQYTNTKHYYHVSLNTIHEGKAKLVSVGTSTDGTAHREISIEVDFYLNYPIPDAALSVNGKLNLDDLASINDGCEGLGADSCLGKGNIAQNMLVSNPNIDQSDSNGKCSGESVDENIIDDGVLIGESLSKVVDKITAEDGSESYDWGKVEVLAGIEDSGSTIDEKAKANSLFEATFGIPMNQANLDNLWGNAFNIDMTNGGDCSDQLQNLGDENEIVFIKGDCNISQYNTAQSKTSDKKVFTIGSVSNPKLVLIQGGTFVSDSTTNTKVVGMVYFIPGKHNLIDDSGNPVDVNGNILEVDQEAIQVEDSSINMGGVNVNGAVLSEYECSYTDNEKKNGSTINQHFSARFDKRILDALYSKMEINTTDSSYRISSGTWRDF